jgi:hypothetical protein
MHLRGEVDDVAGCRSRSALDDQDSARVEFMCVARPLVDAEVLRKCAFELQCETLSHHADAIDSVYLGFSVRLQQVPLRDLNVCHQE